MVFYAGREIKGIDNASASASAGGDIRPHISILVTQAPTARTEIATDW